MSWKTPNELKYTKTDEWVRVEGVKATVGITDYAQDQLSDVVFVELPSPGDVLDQGDGFGTVESVKAAADLNMPVGGEITEVNEALESEPEFVNSDPFGDGWIVRFKIADPSELMGLMDSSAYSQYCEKR